MPVELECKTRIGSLAGVREKLRAAGAEYVGRVLETNRLFDRDDGSLRRAGCGLRVRSVKVLDGTGPPATLTYKGPRQESAFKRRVETEVEISDEQGMCGILQALGYSERIVFEKCRESWRSGPCRIELDELPELGAFVEVEGPDEAAIREVLAALRLSEDALIDQSYAAMVAGRAGEETPSPVTLLFDA